jgi:hypothetical protein
MALDAQGHITLLWEDWTDQHALVSVSADGVSFSTPVIVPGAGVQCGLGPCANDSGVYPHLSVTPSGAINVASIGTESDPRADVISTRSVDGGAHFTAGVDIAFVATAVSSAAGPQGQDYMVFRSPDTSIHFSASLDGGKTFGALVTLVTSDAADAPYIAVDSSGNINVLWSTFDNTTDMRTLAFSRSTDQGATFSTPIVVANGSEFIIPDSEQLAVELGGAIDVVLVQDGSGGGGSVQFVRSINNGATFSTPTNIGNAQGGVPLGLALDSCGGINVAWSNLIDILLTRSTNATTLSTPINLTNLSSSSTVAFRPHIATDSRGNVYLVWGESSSGSANGFFIIGAQHGASCSQ